MTSKHVAYAGRWRIVWRFGRYQTGWHWKRLGQRIVGFSFGLPFMFAAALKRDHTEGET